MSQGKKGNFIGDGSSFLNTPTSPTKMVATRFSSIRSSISHDPFDDDLDSALMKIDVGGEVKELVSASSRSYSNRSISSDDMIPCGQVVSKIDNGNETDNDENDEEEEDQDVPPESSSSEDEVSIGKLHGFGDYATYFQNKTAKQQKADKDYLEWETKRRGGSTERPIFSGCVIHVNGHTVPSINEIHRLVILYGGKFIHYLHNKGAATHIICDKLTPRKMIQFKNYKVVKAQWLVDSISKGELLDWSDYRVIEDVVYGQQRLGFSKLEDKIEEEEVEKQVQSEIIMPNDPESDDEMIPLTQSQNEQNEEVTLSQSGEAHIEELNTNFELTANRQLDARNPDFLKHFFAYSRLHHLSTWKAELRARFLKKILNKTTPSQEKKKYDVRVVFHVDFDCFFAAASALNRPDLDINKDPIAVSHGQRTSDVASCNYIARSKGVKNGMWMAQARKLCPELIILDYDFEAYERHSNAMYDYLIQSEIFDAIFPVSVDEVLLDATSYCNANADGVTSTVNALATKLRSDIFSKTSCTVSVGASKNVLLAKLSLRRAKPNGQYYLHENFEEFLENIPARNLPGIGGSIQRKLTAAIGADVNHVPLISDLRKLSLMKLKSIFGEKTGIKLFNYARGIDDTSIDIRRKGDALKRKSVSVDVNYGIRFDTVSQLDIFLIDISKELYRRLIRLTMCGSSITLRLARRAPEAPIEPEKFLGMGHCVFANKSAKFGVPTNDWGIIGSELKALYRMLNIPVHELRGISITMTNLEDVENVKKNRQMKLPFALNTGENDSNKLKPSPVSSPQKFEEENDIDWEVFNCLPLSIQLEQREELLRRGIIPPEVDSHPQPIMESTPTRGTSKVYMQQLIPKMEEEGVSYTKVIESPTRRSPTKRKLQSPSYKQTSPSKRRQSPIKSRLQSPSRMEIPRPNYSTYDETGSYDESVFNALPSSVQKEVLFTLEEKAKNKMAYGHHKSAPVLDSKWLSRKHPLVKLPLFQNKPTTIGSMKSLISGWISSSLLQGGPHLDDVNMMLDYIEKLLQQDNLLRSMSIFQHIKTRLFCESISFESVGSPYTENQDTKALVEVGFKEWRQIIVSSIVPMIQRYCIEHDIEVDTST
ncbi:DNA repair protein Rev1p [[Candida] anglica]